MAFRSSAPVALVYVRVSTAEQADHGASLEAQASMLTVEAERRGYVVELLREEGKSGNSISSRPVLTGALSRLRRGEAAALFAQRLDRVSRSVADFAALLDRSSREGWSLVVTEADVDTSTPSGRFLMNVLASAAQFERDLVSARTRDALAQRRHEGVRLGRPSTLPDHVVARIVLERRNGRSLAAIGLGLEADGIATARGGARWYPATVAKVLSGQAAAQLM
jgi:DNA invertase Pin-like site-specific DNA recombinase